MEIKIISEISSTLSAVSRLIILFITFFVFVCQIQPLFGGFVVVFRLEVSFSVSFIFAQLYLVRKSQVK